MPGIPSMPAANLGRLTSATAAGEEQVVQRKHMCQKR